MNREIITGIRDREILRRSFNELAEKTFGLSFEEWYQAGYWTDAYSPHVITDGERVIANVSVNRIDVCWRGKPRRYIQLGTVMTDSEYRGKGLSRRLLEQVLEEWRENCDGIYLFANDSVLDFYPKFGFQKATEYQCRKQVVPKSGEIRKLDMESEADRKLLKEHYELSNPFSDFAFVNNYGLLMFYCSAFLKDCVYYLPAFDAVVIAEREEDSFLCYDIYCSAGQSMDKILETAADGTDGKVLFGFSPKDTEGCTIAPLKEEDTTLFVLEGKESPFEEGRLIFPLLSHA